MSDEGKRRNPRHALDASIEVQGDNGLTIGRCLNLSSGGLCAELQVPCALGGEVGLAIILVFDNDSFSEPLSLRARSVWCTSLGEGFQVGFQFLALSDDQASYLAMFLRFLEEGRDARRPPATTETDVFS